MALFKHCQGSRYSMQLTIINLLACFACLCGIAFAQFDISEALTGSNGFPDVATACLGNLAVFFTSILRGRLDLDIGARDVLATNRGPKLMKTQGDEDSGLTTCNAKVEGRTKYEDAAVLMLSPNTSDSSIAEFMRYIHHSHGLDSILLKFLPFSPDGSCRGPAHGCKCILLRTKEEEIRMMIARRMPGTLKQRSVSECLLPCGECLTNGCHGCDQGLLHVKQNDLERHDDVNDTEQQRLTEEGPRTTPPAAVCEILGRYLQEKHGCICIPLREADEDEWTKLLIRFMRYKDKVGRGVRVLAADAMEKYIDRSGEPAWVTTGFITEEYTGFSLLVQGSIEVIVNILVTVLLRADGFSSALMARRVVKNYLVDSKGTGFTANAFLTFAEIKCNQSSVCQRLWFRGSIGGMFRGSIPGVRTLAYVVGCVNLICSIAWCLLIAGEESVGKWYGKWNGVSKLPSKYTVIVILIGIAIALLMDSLGLYLLYALKRKPLEIEIRELEESRMKKKIRMVWGVMVLEIIYMVAGCVLIVKGLIWGTWVYSVLQILVWVKWGIGSYLLGDRDARVNRGVMVYSTAFLLNAILAGVRGKP